MATFTLDRPHVKNAINEDIMFGLEQLCENIRSNKSISLLIIQGSGDAFCGGGDVRAFAQKETPTEILPIFQRMADCLYNLATLPVITIAKLNGPAVGGGMELASSCDYRIAISPTFPCGWIQSKLSIPTGWGGTNLLLEAFAQDQVLSWVVPGKKHTALEWKDFGFIHEICETKEEQQTFYQPFLSALPAVVRAYKEAASQKRREIGLRERMQKEAARCAACWGGPEHLETINTFLHKR